MGNETERNQQNPGQQQNNHGNQVDPNQRNPSHTGEHVYNPQDPTTKKPGPDSGTTDRQDRKGSEDVEKRRASLPGSRTEDRGHGKLPWLFPSERHCAKGGRLHPDS